MSHRPNILVLWGDDIGTTKPELLQRRADGAPNNQHRPNRRGGARFTDYYGEQSCTTVHLG